MIEFFIGWTPFKDPLVALEDLNQLPKTQMDEDGFLWTLEQHPRGDEGLLLTKRRQGMILDAYTATRVDGYRLKIAQAYCDSEWEAASCY